MADLPLVSLQDIDTPVARALLATVTETFETTGLGDPVPTIYNYFSGDVSSITACKGARLRQTFTSPASATSVANDFFSGAAPEDSADFFVGLGGDLFEVVFQYSDLSSFFWFATDLPLSDLACGEAPSGVDFFGAAAGVVVPPDFFTGIEAGASVNWLTWGDDVWTFEELTVSGITFDIIP